MPRGGARPGAGRPKRFEDPIDVQLDADHLARLDAIATASQLPRAELLRRIVGLYLDGGQHVRRLPDGDPQLVTVTLTDSESSLNIARNCGRDEADVVHAIYSLPCEILASEGLEGEETLWISDADARDIYRIFAPRQSRRDNP
jgi:hypothetical protein